LVISSSNDTWLAGGITVGATATLDESGVAVVSGLGAFVATFVVGLTSGTAGVPACEFPVTIGVGVTIGGADL